LGNPVPVRLDAVLPDEQVECDLLGGMLSSGIGDPGQEPSAASSTELRTEDVAGQSTLLTITSGPVKRRRNPECGRVLFGIGVLAAVVPLAVPPSAFATTFYVRQRAGDDANDGRSPATAWQHVGMLSAAMRAGDTAYVGPGLYREEIEVRDSGTVDRPILFIADETGRHTGDAPGVVMLTGAEPVNETIFVPGAAPGVYTAPFPAWQVWGVVEMDGPETRYVRATITPEYLVDKLAPADVVAKLRSSFFWDESTRTLVLHTSDDRPPMTHELELMQRGNGIVARDGKEFVTVIGFTFRHMQDAGVSFFKGSAHGTVVRTIAYGSRQGVRVYGSPDVLVYGSTLFRNENAGVYFAAGSTGGRAIGNTSYENVKGLRWSSNSTSGMALDNTLFDNTERGLSLENADGAIVRGNLLAGNAVSQLQVLQSHYSSNHNCFESHPPQLVADFAPFDFTDRYASLAEYQQHQTQDLDSRQGGCAPVPHKLDVATLHARTLGLVETDGNAGTLRHWLGRLFGAPAAAPSDPRR
jgi:parallel beta-helix repeat protein